METPLKKDVEEESEALTKGSLQDDPLEEQTFKVYGYRWAVQLAFCLSMSSTALIMVGFSPIAHIISELYDCSH